MEHTPLTLQNTLSKISGKKIMLMLTNNSQRMLTIKEMNTGVIELRAHKIFLQAEEKIITALGSWIKGNNRYRETIKDYINNNSHNIILTQNKSRKVTLRPQGKYYDLAEIAARINQNYLGNRSSSPVTWGRKVTKRKARTIRLGWYDPGRKLITISQRLDKRDIPYYMVEYVLFHEMLHEVIGIETEANGRRCIHGKKFNLMEKTYPYYNEARQFEKKKWGSA